MKIIKTAKYEKLSKHFSNPFQVDLEGEKSKYTMNYDDWENIVEDIKDEISKRETEANRPSLLDNILNRKFPEFSMEQKKIVRDRVRRDLWMTMY